MISMEQKLCSAIKNRLNINKKIIVQLCNGDEFSFKIFKKTIK